MKVFISYTWENKEHVEWVEALATRLRKDGIETILDQWEVNLGDEITKFMEESIREHDRVLAICTPKYKEKADKRLGGTGVETRQITAEILNDPKQGKVVPVLRRGSWKDAAPSYLLGINGVNLCDGDIERYEQEYHRLLADLLGKRKKAPSVGIPSGETKFDDFKLSFLQDRLMGRAWKIGPNDIRYEDGMLMNRARLKYIVDTISNNAGLTGTTYWISFFKEEEFNNVIQNNIWRNGDTVYTYSETERREVLQRCAHGLKIRLGRILGAEHIGCKVMADGQICCRYVR